MTHVRIHNPFGELPAETAGSSAQEIGDLNGKVVGILENTKPNAAHLLRHLAGHVATRFDEVSVVEYRKTSAALGAEEDIVERLRAEATLVLVGSGD